MAARDKFLSDIHASLLRPIGPNCRLPLALLHCCDRSAKLLVAPLPVLPHVPVASLSELLFADCTYRNVAVTPWAKLLTAPHPCVDVTVWAEMT